MYEKEGVDPKELNFNLEKEVNLDGMEIKKTEDIKELSMSMDQQ